MSKSQSQEKFDVAVELNMLNAKQLESIKLAQQESSITPLKIAIRKGFLTRKQLDVLNVLNDPTAVVPGYRIDGFLGEGGTGTVYKATQLRMDRPVAIKTLNRIAAYSELMPKRFEREAKIIGRLRHPNIVSAFDFGIHNEQLYLVMEFADGIDADQFLAEEKSIPEFQAWHIAQQVCHALENAIQHGVTHRDIKPGNLILTTAPAGTQFPANVPFVKVADFGLAKFNDKQLNATITLDSAVSGTPFYMSPEQIKAEDVDHRSDIYSLGTTIWHLITGIPPITGAGPLDVITNKMKLEDEWLSQTPADISDVGFELLKKMCRHDREHRIDDYPALNREIKCVIEQLANNPLSGARDFELSKNTFSAPAKITTIHELARTYSDQDGSQTDLAEGDLWLSETAELPRPTELFEPAEQVADAEVGGSNQTWPVSRWLALAVGAIALPFIGYAFWPAGQASSNDRPGEVSPFADEPTTKLIEFSGPPRFLFDGRNIDPTQKFTGTWEPAKGAEGESILSGKGTRNFRCEDADRNPLEVFQFVCGFRHNQADAIGFRLMDESNEKIWSVSIEPDKATLNDGVTSSMCPLQQFDEEKNFGYHLFRMESQPAYWLIEIDNQILGEIPKPDDFANGELTIQLFVDGPKAAHFEQIRLRAFKEK